MIGRIYGYQDRYSNWVYVGATVRPLAARHTTHRKRRHFGFGRVLHSWPRDQFRGPFLLEEVGGRNRRDLLFNMAWQEMVWMFHLRTLWPIFGQGRNQRLPEFKFGSYRRIRGGARRGAAQVKRLARRNPGLFAGLGGSSHTALHVRFGLFDPYCRECHRHALPHEREGSLARWLVWVKRHLGCKPSHWPRHPVFDHQRSVRPPYDPRNVSAEVRAKLSIAARGQKRSAASQRKLNQKLRKVMRSSKVRSTIKAGQRSSIKFQAYLTRLHSEKLARLELRSSNHRC